MTKQSTDKQFKVTFVPAKDGVQSEEKIDGCRGYPYRPNPKEWAFDPLAGTTFMCSIAFRIPGKKVVILQVHERVWDAPLSADADWQLLRSLYNDLYTRRERRQAAGDYDGYLAGTLLCNEREEAYEKAGCKTQVGKFLKPDWVKRAQAYLAEPYDEAAADAAMAERDF